MLIQPNPLESGYISETGVARGTITGNVAGTLTGAVQISGSVLTVGTMTHAESALVRQVIHKFTWANAMVVALGAVLAGDIDVCTLPARTVVKNAYIVVGTAASGPTTLTMSLGRTGATYVDYLGNADIKAAANTVYGDVSGERGANLTGYDLPSVTATTLIRAHLIATVTNLNTTTGSTGTIYLVTETLP